MEDKAAKFIQNQNTLLVNADFRVSVMQRYHVYIACRRDLGAKFGKFSAVSG